MIKQSKHHIIIEPNNNNFDRYLIQDIVKEYARRYPNAANALFEWYHELLKSDYKNFNELKKEYPGVSLISDDSKLQKMSNNAKSFAQTNAAQILADKAIELVK